MHDPETGRQAVALRMPDGDLPFGERNGDATVIESEGRPSAAASPAAADTRPGFDPDAPADGLLDRQATSVWVFDIDHGRIVWANAQALRTWRADSLDELSSRSMGKDMSPAMGRRLKQYQTDFIDNNAVFNEQWTIYPRGIPRTMRISLSGIRLADGRTAMLCEGIEWTSGEPEAVRSAEALLHTQLLISLHDGDGRTLYLNPAAWAAFDSGRVALADRFVNRDDYVRLDKAVRQRGEISITAPIRTSTGIQWHDVTARTCLDPVSGSPSVLVSATDVSELKEAEALARSMALRDPLTGIPNRLAQTTLFARLGGKARAMGARLGLFFIDLDQFKSINDTLGHQYGDAFLLEVARRLEALCSEDDAVIRLGGDEFLYMATAKNGSADEFEALATTLLARLSVPLEYAGRRIMATPSIGIACFPDHGNDVQTLLQCADLAMYEAKNRGRNQHQMFEEHYRARMENRLRLLADLEDALASGQFEAHYQPRYNPSTGRAVTIEALVRWNHPQRGLVMPAEFIPLCEKTGHINRLGAHILEQALRQQCEWRRQGIDVTVAVNVSLRQLSEPGFGALVSRLLQETGGDGARLELELTETLLVKGSRVVHDNLDTVQALGIRIAIDDFGTGYSNLARLSEMAVDCIKIDRSLFRSLPQTAPIIETAIALCRQMKVTIVAEGIETIDAAEWARDHGCHELQGFFYCHPMAAADLTPRLLEHAAEPT